MPWQIIRTDINHPGQNALFALELVVLDHLMKV